MNFGLYFNNTQIGFARVITDYATFAYLGDVFILEKHRGNGLGTWLIECVMSHPDLQNLRNWSLLTSDAHQLYRKFGFQTPESLTKFMEIRKPDLYL